MGDSGCRGLQHDDSALNSPRDGVPGFSSFSAKQNGSNYGFCQLYSKKRKTGAPQSPRRRQTLHGPQAIPPPLWHISKLSKVQAKGRALPDVKEKR